MKKFPVFIDSNSLCYIPKIEKISKGKVVMEYYYPDIDRFMIAKEEHIRSVRKHNELAENRNKATYFYKNTELGKFLQDSSPLPYGRFHRVFRPDSPAFFGQTYLGREALTNENFGEFTRDIRTLNKFNKIVTRLEKVLEIEAKLNKDIYVLGTVIHVNNIYEYFLTLKTDGSFAANLGAKRSIYFEPRKKLFLTDDSSFPFTKTKQIENAFPTICIQKTEVFLDNFDKYIN